MYATDYECESEIANLLDEIADLRRELDEMRQQRDAAIAELERLARVDTTFFIKRNNRDQK